jgi:hypothetical protein
MFVRFGATLILGVVSVASSPTYADTTLQCSETIYDKTGNNPYDITHYFILQDGGIFKKAILRWDNKKLDLSLVTNTPASIEATGKTAAQMPLPTQIDQCVNTVVSERPELREANGEINMFTVLHCVYRADQSDNEVPIDVTVTINRVTGHLRIHRRQDNNSQHDFEDFGSCKATKPLF